MWTVVLLDSSSGKELLRYSDRDRIRAALGVLRFMDKDLDRRLDAIGKSTRVNSASHPDRPVNGLESEHTNGAPSAR